MNVLIMVAASLFIGIKEAIKRGDKNGKIAPTLNGNQVFLISIS